MAQLFTIYFPTYYFDLQKEFSIQIENFALPFEYVVEAGSCYVSVVHYDQDNQGDPHFWHKKGLQPGLRVIAINNRSLIDEYNDEDDDGNIDPDNILNEDVIEDILANVDTEKFTIEFREEISPEDYSISLGLGYNEQDIKNDDILNDKMEEEKFMSLQMTSLSTRHSMIPSSSLHGVMSMKNLFERIEDSQIGASSFEKGYEPSQCRLNNPISFWQPSGDDQTTLDTWLRIDLAMKKMVTKLHLQGSLDHSSYVRSFWIDYSDDCCQWKSHPLGEIKCKYKNHSNKSKLTTLHNDDENKNVYAEIIIWPAITARFIRFRPYTVENKVAVRLELYGFKQVVSTANLSFARVVSLYDVSEIDKMKLMEQVTNLPVHTKVIQVDCKAVISAALDRAGLTSVGFLKADDDSYLCIFTTPNAEASEFALDELADIGVGREMGVISTTAVAFRSEPQKRGRSLSSVKRKKKKGQTFSESVTSRRIVKQVVERVMNSSAFTFDYICMLIVASLIAAGGMATDNSVIVVASMLVSPLMGPVLAFTFGVTLKEGNMAKLGLKNEIFSLVMCVISGFVVGFLYSLISKNSNNWPTEQMSSRGTIEGLAYGAFIAAASGVGVALSVLGDSLSTVVGVAISASLLPPAVNSGMLFAFPIIAILYPEWIPSNKRYKNKKHLLKMAGYSLLLTVENIIIIFAVSRMMFWIKNVYITKDHHEKVWKSVTNFGQNYSKLASMRAKTLRNTMDRVSRQSDIHDTLREKMKESLRFAMDYDDFEAINGTIKGGVIALSRQRSTKMKEVMTSELNTQIASLMVPDGNAKRISLSMSKSGASKQGRSPRSKSNDSTDSEESDVEEKQRATVNDIFALMKTSQHQPIESNVDDDDDEEAMMEHAIQLAVIDHNQKKT